MRLKLKYIFCGLILAALIFISFCVFYIANTYAVNTKNKNEPIFPYHSVSYFANIGNSEIREIENTPPLTTPIDGEKEQGEIPDGLVVISEPSGDEPEPEPDSEIVTESNSEYAQEETENVFSFEPYETESTSDNFVGSDTDKLLLEILTTMKINQVIMIFVLAFIACIIFISKIFSPFIDEPFTLNINPNEKL